MILHKVGLTHFWGFVFHGYEVENSDVSILRRVLEPGGTPVQSPVWAPLKNGTLDARNFDGYAISAGELLGAKAPSQPYPGPRSHSPADIKIRSAHQAWWAEAKRLVDEAGCCFVMFGDDEDEEFIAVAIKDSVTEPAEFGISYRQCSLALPDRYPNEADWVGRLHDFCKRVGIEWQEPSWQVVARACASARASAAARCAPVSSGGRRSRG